MIGYKVVKIIIIGDKRNPMVHILVVHTVGMEVYYNTDVFT